MVKVGYDIYTPPIVEKAVLLNANLIYDTSVSPPAMKGWFEPNLKLGFKTLADGQLYLDSAFTKPLFANAVPPFPSSGAYDFMLLVPLKNSVIAVWLGKTTNNYDTPVIVVINKQIEAMLIYNLSANSIQVNHYTDVYPNYETNGSYSNGVVTLSQGQYVLFYGATKPTVNPNAKWGFTDYEPKSTTTQPSVYIDVTNGTNHYYYESTIELNVIMRYDIGAILTDINGMKLSFLGLWFRMLWRGSKKGHNVMYLPLGGGLATSYTLRPFNLTTENIYDYDPPAGTSWMEGLIADNIVYVKDNEGITIIHRMVKNTTDPINPRYTIVVGYKYVKQGTDTVKVKAISAHKTYANVTSYGSGNQVVNPGLGFDSYVNPATFEYFDGSTWNTATPGSNAYNYYTGYGMRAELYNPLNTAEKYKAVAILRKHKRYGTPTVKVGALKFSSYPDNGLIAIFQDYNGGTIPAGNYICFIFDVVVTTQTTYPTVTTETPTEDTDIWSYLYGYPYDISISAPSSATPGSTVTVTVSTNAPDGTKVYVVDKDTDTVLGSGTVTSGQATISFTMPSKDLKIRVYVEGADITLS
jgi:hypothetical protein